MLTQGDGAPAAFADVEEGLKTAEDEKSDVDDDSTENSSGDCASILWILIRSHDNVVFTLFVPR